MINQFKTVILFALLTGFFMFVGQLVGGREGMWIGLLFAGVGNFVSYFFSDKMVLSQYGAKPLTQTEAPRLYAIVERLARQANIPMPKLYLIDMPTPNAFATGRDPSHAAVAVSPSIMNLMSEEELEGVLAHELGHVKNRDILISTIAATVAGAISYLSQIFYYSGQRSSSDGDRRASPAGLILVLLLSPIVATLLHLAISRQREYSADDFGARLTHNPRGLSRALAKLGGIVREHPLTATPGQATSAHLFIINPFDPSLIKSLFSTHPSLADRIKRLETMQI